jgi:hypothetical protein
MYIVKLTVIDIYLLLVFDHFGFKFNEIPVTTKDKDYNESSSTSEEELFVSSQIQTQTPSRIQTTNDNSDDCDKIVSSLHSAMEHLKQLEKFQQLGHKIYDIDGIIHINENLKKNHPNNDKTIFRNLLSVRDGDELVLLTRVPIGTVLNKEKHNQQLTENINGDVVVSFKFGWEVTSSHTTASSEIATRRKHKEKEDNGDTISHTNPNPNNQSKKGYLVLNTTNQGKQIRANCTIGRFVSS